MPDSPLDLALDFIYSFIDYEKQRDPHIKTVWDLRRVDALLARLGNPILKLKPCILPAARARAAPRHDRVRSDRSSYKTGLYTSPHLHLFNERIRVDDKLISNDEIVELVAKIKPEVEAVNEEALYGRLTTFEVTTVLDFVTSRRIKPIFR